MAKKKDRMKDKTTHTIEMKISKIMKTDLTLGIQNPHQIQDIIFQTIAHVTIDIKITKQILEIEITSI